MAGRQAQRGKFIKTLKGLSGSPGNGRLRGILGWNADTYAAVKDALRDTLLPKLISGELRIRDAERVIESAA
jgi:hypothetical protein